MKFSVVKNHYMLGTQHSNDMFSSDALIDPQLHPDICLKCLNGEASEWKVTMLDTLCEFAPNHCVFCGTGCYNVYTSKGLDFCSRECRKKFIESDPSPCHCCQFIVHDSEMCYDCLYGDPIEWKHTFLDSINEFAPNQCMWCGEGCFDVYKSKGYDFCSKECREEFIEFDPSPCHCRKSY